MILIFKRNVRLIPLYRIMGVINYNLLMFVICIHFKLYLTGIFVNRISWNFENNPKINLNLIVFSDEKNKRITRIRIEVYYS
jgi:hypothetical protein